MANMIRFAPGFELGRMHNEFDRLFSDVFPAFSGPRNRTHGWVPRTDLAETDEAYIFTIDVPGLSKDDVEINVHDGVLSIAGERTSETKDESIKHLRIERSKGSFERRFSLPKDVNVENISAKQADGILTISIPKKEEAKPVRVSVN